MSIPAEDEGQLRGFSVYALGRVAKVTRAGPPGAQFSFGWGAFVFRRAQLGCRLEPDWLCSTLWATARLCRYRQQGQVCVSRGLAPTAAGSGPKAGLLLWPGLSPVESGDGLEAGLSRPHSR